MTHLFLCTMGIAQCTNRSRSSAHNSVIIHWHICLPHLAWGLPLAGQELDSMQLCVPGTTRPIIGASQMVSKRLVKHHPTHDVCGQTLGARN